jgi:hypothetical protein
MTTPKQATTLVERLMDEARGARWERQPPLTPAPENEVRSAEGPTWTLVVVRWKRGSEFHYEATASTRLKSTPLIVRVPETDASVMWTLSDQSS